jgi:uracil-DNA glycosylase family 4
MLREFGWLQGSEDKPILREVRIVNAVRCVPPVNRPVAAEIRNCNRFLAEELEAAGNSAVILSLGTIAHRAVLMAKGLPAKTHKFGHELVHKLPQGVRMVDSYHCSRYNTQTGRLTVPMFRNIFNKISKLVEK